MMTSAMSSRLTGGDRQAAVATPPIAAAAPAAMEPTTLASTNPVPAPEHKSTTHASRCLPAKDHDIAIPRPRHNAGSDKPDYGCSSTIGCRLRTP